MSKVCIVYAPADWAGHWKVGAWVVARSGTAHAFYRWDNRIGLNFSMCGLMRMSRHYMKGVREKRRCKTCIYQAGGPKYRRVKCSRLKGNNHVNRSRTSTHET